MTTQAPKTKSSTTFRPRVRRLGPDRYLVESSSRPGVGHPVVGGRCNCTGFAYRGTCRHVTLVAAIERPMQAWYTQAATASVATASRIVSVASAPTAPAAPNDGLAFAEARLDSARRALADTDRQADEYAGYLRQVDQAERALRRPGRSGCAVSMMAHTNTTITTAAALHSVAGPAAPLDEEPRYRMVSGGRFKPTNDAAREEIRRWNDYAAAVTARSVDQ